MVGNFGRKKAASAAQQHGFAGQHPSEISAAPNALRFKRSAWQVDSAPSADPLGVICAWNALRQVRDHFALGRLAPANCTNQRCELGHLFDPCARGEDKLPLLRAQKAAYFRPVRKTRNAVQGLDHPKDFAIFDAARLPVDKKCLCTGYRRLFPPDDSCKQGNPVDVPEQISQQLVGKFRARAHKLSNLQTRAGRLELSQHIRLWPTIRGGERIVPIDQACMRYRQRIQPHKRRTFAVDNSGQPQPARKGVKRF
ncbi:MAG: hypothetical protein VW339_03640 [Quisquiliibacterium sp.]